MSPLHKKTIDRLKKIHKSQQSVGNLRRVGHSLSNKIRSKSGRKGRAKDAVLEVANATAAAGAATTGFMAAGLASGAVLTGAAAGAATFFASPVVATVVGTAGLINLAYSSYSNRDSAHKILAPHVWSYIDNQTPLPFWRNDKVKAAALYLILNGQSQQGIKDVKMASRKQALEQWRNKLKIINGKSKKRLHIWEGLDKGGAVFELVRRQGHNANYLQAYTIVGKIMQNDPTPLDDFAKYVGGVKEMRGYWAEFAKIIDVYVDEVLV